jgi:hypothetical protein
VKQNECSNYFFSLPEQNISGLLVILSAKSSICPSPKTKIDGFGPNKPPSLKKWEERGIEDTKTAGVNGWLSTGCEFRVAA